MSIKNKEELKKSINRLDFNIGINGVTVTPNKNILDYFLKRDLISVSNLLEESYRECINCN